MVGRRAEHNGAVKTKPATKTGDPIEIWVDNDGAQVPAPTPTTRAAVEAVTGALLIWVGVGAAAATMFAVTRAVCAVSASPDGNTTSTAWSATATDTPPTSPKTSPPHHHSPLTA